MPKVRAIEAGYDNIALRQPGDVFDWPKVRMAGDKEIPNPIPPWCEVVEESAKKGGKQGATDLA